MNTNVFYPICFLIFTIVFGGIILIHKHIELRCVQNENTNYLKSLLFYSSKFIGWITVAFVFLFPILLYFIFKNNYLWLTFIASIPLGIIQYAIISSYSIEDF